MRVVNFGSEGEATNPIDPARPAKAGLAYLGLGDWHRTLQVGPALWYAGTPEPAHRCPITKIVPGRPSTVTATRGSIEPAALTSTDSRARLQPSGLVGRSISPLPRREPGDSRTVAGTRLET